MPTPLTGLDASFLYLETRSSHMHVASALVLDPSTAPDGALSLEQLKRYLLERLHVLPPFRRRLVQIPLRLDHPMWIEDPDFDIDYHVRRAALPAPGGLDQLGEFVGDFMSRALDRSRPLWEVWLIEGLEDGRVAICSKTHHAAIDGVSGAELLAAVLQTEPDQAPPPPEFEWQPEREPGALSLIGRAGLRIATRPWQAVGAARRVLGAAPGLVKVSRSTGLTTPPPPFTAPMTSINGAIGPHRRVAFADMSLPDVKEVKDALEGTVNDVVLAVVAGGLRSYLDDRGDALDAPLVGMVPVSTRAETGQGIGNSVTAMLVELPIDEADPVARLHRVSASTTGAKTQTGALGATTIQQLVELAPAGVSSLAARTYTRLGAANRHRPIWNVVISNVPGPRIPLYYAGARVEQLYPIGPVHEMVGLNITLFSYADRIFIGLNGDRDLVPDIRDLARDICRSFDDLAKAAKNASA